MSIAITVLLVIWMIVALLMILVILMQRPKSEGLGAAFGGGVTENIFGAQTTNVLVKFTGYLAAIFFLITFALSILYAKQGSGGSSALRQELLKTQATPQASPAPGAASSPATASGSTAAPAGSPLPSASAPATANIPAASRAAPVPAPAAQPEATAAQPQPAASAPAKPPKRGKP
jgi:preprotein translocase subunit SecG